MKEKVIVCVFSHSEVLFCLELVGLGAKLVKSVSLADVYLDTTDYSLIRADNWLRFRYINTYCALNFSRFYKNQSALHTGFCNNKLIRMSLETLIWGDKCSHYAIYRVFIKYCVFSKILKYILDSGPASVCKLYFGGISLLASFCTPNR